LAVRSATQKYEMMSVHEAVLVLDDTFNNVIGNSS
jgi:hypothetical protein